MSVHTKDTKGSTDDPDSSTERRNGTEGDPDEEEDSPNVLERMLHKSSGEMTCVDKQKSSKKEQKVKNYLTLSYIMWENNSNICWLDASMSLLIHNKSVRQLADGDGSSLVSKIIRMFDEAISLVNDDDNPKDIHLRVIEAKAMLKRIQDSALAYLQPLVKFKDGEPDSAFCSLYNLIAENKVTRSLFEVDYALVLECDKCKLGKASKHKKPAITLAKARAFDPLSPISVCACPSCKEQDQNLRLSYRSLPQSLVFHFENGAGKGEFSALDFAIADRHYKLTGLMILEKCLEDPDLNHFVTWIRDPLTDSWLECNDLNSEIVTFTVVPPFIQLEDVYIAMYEAMDSKGTVTYDSGNLEEDFNDKVARGAGDIPFIDLSADEVQQKGEAPEGSKGNGTKVTSCKVQKECKEMQEAEVSGKPESKENEQRIGETSEESKGNGTKVSKIQKECQKIGVSGKAESKEKEHRIGETPKVTNCNVQKESQEIQKTKVSGKTDSKENERRIRETPGESKDNGTKVSKVQKAYQEIQKTKVGGKAESKENEWKVGKTPKVTSCNVQKESQEMQKTKEGGKTDSKENERRIGGTTEESKDDGTKVSKVQKAYQEIQKNKAESKESESQSEKVTPKLSFTEKKYQLRSDAKLDHPKAEQAIDSSLKENDSEEKDPDASQQVGKTNPADTSQVIPTYVNKDSKQNEERIPSSLDMREESKENLITEFSLTENIKGTKESSPVKSNTRVSKKSSETHLSNNLKVPGRKRKTLDAGSKKSHIDSPIKPLPRRSCRTRKHTQKVIESLKQTEEEQKSVDDYSSVHKRKGQDFKSPQRVVKQVKVELKKNFSLMRGSPTDMVKKILSPMRESSADKVKKIFNSKEWEVRRIDPPTPSAKPTNQLTPIPVANSNGSSLPMKEPFSNDAETKQPQNGHKTKESVFSIVLEDTQGDLDISLLELQKKLKVQNSTLLKTDNSELDGKIIGNCPPNQQSVLNEIALVLGSNSSNGRALVSMKEPFSKSICNESHSEDSDDEYKAKSDSEIKQPQNDCTTKENVLFRSPKSVPAIENSFLSSPPKSSLRESEKSRESLKAISLSANLQTVCHDPDGISLADGNKHTYIAKQVKNCKKMSPVYPTAAMPTVPSSTSPKASAKQKMKLIAVKMSPSASLQRVCHDPVKTSLADSNKRTYLAKDRKETTPTASPKAKQVKDLKELTLVYPTSVMPTDPSNTSPKASAKQKTKLTVGKTSPSVRLQRVFFEPVKTSLADGNKRTYLAKDRKDTTPTSSPKASAKQKVELMAHQISPSVILPRVCLDPVKNSSAESNKSTYPAKDCKDMTPVYPTAAMSTASLKASAKRKESVSDSSPQSKRLKTNSEAPIEHTIHSTVKHFLKFTYNFFQVDPSLNGKKTR